MNESLLIFIYSISCNECTFSPDILRDRRLSSPFNHMQNNINSVRSASNNINRLQYFYYFYVIRQARID